MSDSPTAGQAAADRSKDALKERIDAAIRLSDGDMPIVIQVETEEDKLRGAALLKGRHRAAAVEVMTRSELADAEAEARLRIDRQHGVIEP